MDAVLDLPTKTSIHVSGICVPDGDRPVLGSGSYGGLDAFASISGRESFGKGEGLPGKAWAEARPVVLKEFQKS